MVGDNRSAATTRWRPQTQQGRPRRDGLAASDSFAFGVPDTGVVVDHEPHLAALYTDRVARMI